MKARLDLELVQRGLTSTRSQAENYIKLGYVEVDGRLVNKPGTPVTRDNEISIKLSRQYVSRAALKLAGAAKALELDFRGKIVLDVGSSTGGFTQYALNAGADKVIAVDVGSNQLHPELRTNLAVELHESTDIRNFTTDAKIDMAVVDVSFISLREVLPAVARLSGPDTQIIAMCKPQFETGSKDMHKGVVKNDTMRRSILKDFEDWARARFVVQGKADSEVTGAKGNRERFYVLQKSPKGR